MVQKISLSNRNGLKKANGIVFQSSDKQILEATATKETILGAGSIDLHKFTIIRNRFL